MSIKESALSAITSITQSDFVRAVTAAGASRRVTVANLAKAIIESYTGSSLAGENQSVKAALDALNSKTEYGLNSFAISGGNSKNVFFALPRYAVVTWCKGTTATGQDFLYYQNGLKVVPISRYGTAEEPSYSFDNDTLTITNNEAGTYIRGVVVKSMA